MDGFSFLRVIKIMKRQALFIIGWILCSFLSLFSCGEGGKDIYTLCADSLNRSAYEMRYKNLDECERLATQALEAGRKYASVRAEALNNLAFCAFIRMDFDRSDSLLNEVFRTTGNELECLVADVGMMKICQRTSMNKEFYDYRNSAIRRIKRISEDHHALADPSFLKRFRYACSEFSITTAIYYYYLQQESQSLEAIHEIRVEEELRDDTAQLLYYYYMKGSGGMYEADTPEDIVVGEFDYLMDCLQLSHEQGYVYFEANASQAMAELLKSEDNYFLLKERRPGMMRVINRDDLPWEELVVRLGQKAIDLFTLYGDSYQISGSYRTLASCLNEQGKHEEALDCLTRALSFVNEHHERYYHCPDTADRLKPFVPMATTSIELQWINDNGIKTVPEWIARFREQLSVTYAALGMKPESDYNRNIYLDILDYTRQDKELESRYLMLERESDTLSVLLVIVVTGIILLVVLLWMWNHYWRKRNTLYISKLKDTLEITRLIIASIPDDAEDVDDIITSLKNQVNEKILTLVNADDMHIHVTGSSDEPLPGYNTVIPLQTAGNVTLGTWTICSQAPLPKDDKALLQVIAPYITWALENGLSLISLGDRRKLLEKEQYVYERHLIENKRQNVVKKACLFIVTGITPYIDRVINEVHKLIAYNYLADPAIKESKYRYISELTTRINEYNDILALWIKMRQGTLHLNIENFSLSGLFDVLLKSRRTFEAKNLTLEVKCPDVYVKADRALTLFMVNTLAENARKYTPAGGRVEIAAREETDYVEISVTDTGIGLSAEDVNRILGEKVYDSGKIGMQSAPDTDALLKNKGSGFGLMNCKGIIEKYRKTNELFKVCCFCIDSEPGKGSRFYFRLPKGVRKAMLLMWMAVGITVVGCTSSNQPTPSVDNEPMTQQAAVEDSLLKRADEMASYVYYANLEGRFHEALNYADSALVYLNTHYITCSGSQEPLMQLDGKGNAAELSWFAAHFDTDYYTLLDVRNEAAVAHLALGNLDAYRYNNNAYTSLYKQISTDYSLEDYCVRMERSTGGKWVAIILCIVLLVGLLLGYYLLYFRHLLAYRYNLEQVLEINRRAFTLPMEDGMGSQSLASRLVDGLFKDIHELIPVDALGMAVFRTEQQTLDMVFSSPEMDHDEIRHAISTCYHSQKPVVRKEWGLKCIPLCVTAGEERVGVGVLALMGVHDVEREDDSLMLELVASYLAVMVYHAVELVARKYHDIEVAHDEARRLQREENLLHVQNQVLDNCLSTIKHETIYYPNKIRQIVEKLNQGKYEGEERSQVETMAELVAYYKDVFTLLSSCASRQLEEVTFRRNEVKAVELANHAARYLKKQARKMGFDIDWQVEVEDVSLNGDSIQLNYLLENLIDEALTHTGNGRLELKARKDGNFVRFDFIDRRRTLTQEELDLLFYPHLSKINRKDEEVLAGTEYLICKQIIREHDEYAGRRGCRINAQQADGGGFRVWFTIPIR